METWLIFAIISVFAAGLHNFTLKIAAEKQYDVSVINIYSYAIAAIIFGIYILFDYQNMVFDNFLIILTLAILNSFFFFLSMFSRIASMKNIDTVIFFPLYKTMGPILVTFVSIFLFGENLEFKEIIGIIVGITISLLLITNSEKKIQKNLF